MALAASAICMSEEQTYGITSAAAMCTSRASASISSGERAGGAYTSMADSIFLSRAAWMGFGRLRVRES